MQDVPLQDTESLTDDPVQDDPSVDVDQAPDQDVSAQPESTTGAMISGPMVQTANQELFAPEKRSVGIGGILVVLLLCGALGSAGYLWWQGRTAQAQVDRIDTSIAKIQDSIDKFESQTDVNAQVVSASIYRVVKDERIEWSSISRDILALENSTLKFTSFSTAQDKKVSVNGKAKTVEDISRFLEILKNNPATENAFVSNISEGGLSSSRRVSRAELKDPLRITFQVTFDYIDLPDRKIAPSSLPN